jgi:hypothetical protein
LADDLERYLKDEPIRARRPTLMQRARKWTRRHLPVVWTAGVSLVAMLILAVIGLAASNILITREKAHTDAAKQELECTLYYQRIALAEREWSATLLTRAEELLEACPARLRGWEWYYVKRLRLEGLSPLRHPTPVQSAVFSPDGRWIASGSLDGKITVWDAISGREQFAFPAHESMVWSVAFSPDGRRLATASQDGKVKVWGFDPLRTEGEKSPLHTLTGHQGSVPSVAFSPDGQCLASAGWDAVRVWDVATGHELFPIRGGVPVWLTAQMGNGSLRRATIQP